MPARDRIILDTGDGAAVTFMGDPEDALFAAMFYVIFRLVWNFAPLRTIAFAAAATMTAFELFQLTGIPAEMSTSASPLVRISARLLGTEFSWFDLAAYAVGIAALLWLDLIMLQRGAIGHPQP